MPTICRLWGLALISVVVLAGCATDYAAPVSDAGLRSPWYETSAGSIAFEKLDYDQRLHVYVANARTSYAMQNVPANHVALRLQTQVGRNTLMVAEVSDGICSRPFLLSIANSGSTPGWRWIGNCGSAFVEVPDNDSNTITLQETAASGAVTYWRADRDGNASPIAPPQQQQLRQQAPLPQEAKPAPPTITPPRSNRPVIATPKRSESTAPAPTTPTAPASKRPPVTIPIPSAPKN